MSKINRGTGEKSPEPFRTHAGKYEDLALPVFPCNGKKPALPWGRLKTRMVKPETLTKWEERFPACNIAMTTGRLSNITVVDCDDPDKPVPELIEEYGYTPVIVRTPSGGHHLYYKNSGEASRIRVKGKIDIKGHGGYVLVPPSYNPETGKQYAFIYGSILDLTNLPPMKAVEQVQLITEGRRNGELFYYLKEQAFDCQQLSELEKLAYDFNRHHLKPSLPPEEVKRTVKKIWQYKQEGRLFRKGDRFLNIEMNEKAKALMFQHPPAWALYTHLVFSHKGIRKEFAVGQKGVGKSVNWAPGTVKSIDKCRLAGMHLQRWRRQG